MHISRIHDVTLQLVFALTKYYFRIHRPISFISENGDHVAENWATVENNAFMCRLDTCNNVQS